MRSLKILVILSLIMAVAGPVASFDLPTYDSLMSVQSPSLSAAERKRLSPYLVAMVRKIRRHWFPQKDGSGRTVVVGFTLEPGGAIMNPKILVGLDGYSNKVAIDAVTNSAPFSAFPEEFQKFGKLEISTQFASEVRKSSR